MLHSRVRLRSTRPSAEPPDFDTKRAQCAGCELTVACITAQAQMGTLPNVQYGQRRSQRYNHPDGGFRRITALRNHGLPGRGLVALHVSSSTSCCGQLQIGSCAPLEWPSGGGVHDARSHTPISTREFGRLSPARPRDLSGETQVSLNRTNA